MFASMHQNNTQTEYAVSRDVYPDQSCSGYTASHAHAMPKNCYTILLQTEHSASRKVSEIYQTDKEY